MDSFSLSVSASHFCFPSSHPVQSASSSSVLSLVCSRLRRRTKSRLVNVGAYTSSPHSPAHMHPRAHIHTYAKRPAIRLSPDRPPSVQTSPANETLLTLTPIQVLAWLLSTESDSNCVCVCVCVRVRACIHVTLCMNCCTNSCHGWRRRSRKNLPDAPVMSSGQLLRSLGSRTNPRSRATDIYSSFYSYDYIFLKSYQAYHIHSLAPAFNFCVNTSFKFPIELFIIYDRESHSYLTVIDFFSSKSVARFRHFSLPDGAVSKTHNVA